MPDIAEHVKSWVGQTSGVKQRKKVIPALLAEQNAWRGNAAEMHRRMEATETKAVETKETSNVVKDVPKAELDQMIRQHIYAAIGVSLVPIPLVDLVGLTGVQLNLLRVLAKKYDIPFLKDTVKQILSVLVGSATPVAVGVPLAASLAKFIPFLGETVAVITMPVVAGASTYAIGKVFIQHFASGGTFLTFNPEKVKAYYAEMFEEGEKVAVEVKKDKDKEKKS